MPAAHAAESLAHALQADVVVFTSPAAVRHAAALMPLRPGDAPWLAVGGGTAAALRRAGVAQVQVPQRMDSEGLLALPALQRLQDRRVGVVTAPGGREAVVPALRARGAQVLRADVYQRQACALDPRALAQLQALAAPAFVLLSSGQALARVLEQLPEALQATLRRLPVVAASARLAEAAAGYGIDVAAVAAGPRPSQLLAAAAAAHRHALIGVADGEPAGFQF